MVNDYSEPSMVLHTLPCPHRTYLTILPLAVPLIQAALELRVPAWRRQQAGEPARGQGVAAPKDPVLMDLEFPRSGSHCEQEKHSQGRAMGKGPPAQHSQPQPLPHSPAWHPGPFTQGDGCIAPEERCCTKAGLPQLPYLLEEVCGVVRMPGYARRGEGWGGPCMVFRRCSEVLGGEGGGGMLAQSRGGMCHLSASQIYTHPVWALTPTSAFAASMDQQQGPPEPRPAGPATHLQPKVSPGLSGCNGQDYMTPSPLVPSSWSLIPGVGTLVGADPDPL